MTDSTQTLDLLSWRAPASRSTDPETSALATADATPRASRCRMMVLKALGDGPATDFELGDRTGLQQTSAGKRRGELVVAGLVAPMIEPNGDFMRRPAPSGSLARVWCRTAAGREFYERNSGGK